MKLGQAIGLAVAAAGAAVAAVLFTRDHEQTAPVQAAVPQEAASKPNPLAQLQTTAEQGFDLAKQGLSFFNDLKAAISP